MDPANEDRPRYEVFCARLGLDARHNLTIPSSSSPPFTSSVESELAKSKVFAEAYLELLDNMGTNFWWLDDTPDWVARILYEHSATKMQHGLAFARWGGLGSHRYPIGFSGDTYMEWESLAFQPYFTATASNVFFYWSHDIGGHRSTRCPSTTEPGEPCEFGHTQAAYDPELYLRWVQWGAHSPILRTHPQPDPKVERRPFGYPLPVSEYMRSAFARRGRLVPALFTANRKAQEASVPALRPLYHEYPEPAGAYLHRDTYLFLDGLLVAPVTAPQCNTTETATRALWLPPGRWVDTVSGVETASPVGGTEVRYPATLWETPVFAKAGTVLPLTSHATRVRTKEAGGGRATITITHPSLGSAATEPQVGVHALVLSPRSALF